jgi:hypothetical protein
LWGTDLASLSVWEGARQALPLPPRFFIEVERFGTPLRIRTVSLVASRTGELEALSVEEWQLDRVVVAFALLYVLGVPRLDPGPSQRKVLVSINHGTASYFQVNSYT